MTNKITSENFNKIFKRDDIRGIYPDHLDENVVERVGKAFTLLLKKDFNDEITPRIAIGYDARISSPIFAQAFAKGVVSAGGKSYLQKDICSSEHMYFAVGEYGDFIAGSAMITASHNPREYNGIKMTKKGCIPLEKSDLKWIQGEILNNFPHENKIIKEAKTLADEKNQRKDQKFNELISNPKKLVNEFNHKLFQLSGLIERLKDPKFDDLVNHPLKVVIEAGNGVGGLSFRPLAEKLEQTGKIKFIYTHDKPDGSFPVCLPNPILSQYQELTYKMVREHQADLGICFDGDGDRAGFIDGTPGISATDAALNASQICMLVLKKLLQKNKVKRPIIMKNICSSQLLDKELAKLGIDFELVQTPVGHGRIKSLMRLAKIKERVIFAGEHSAHYFYPDFFSIDSGILTSLNMLELAVELKASGENLSTILNDWREKFVWSGELNFKFSHDESPMKTILKLADTFESKTMSRYEVARDPETNVYMIGKTNSPYKEKIRETPDLKLITDQTQDQGWWFVVRPSGTEPKLRLNVEAWGSQAQTRMSDKCQEIMAIIIDEMGGEKESE